MYYDEGRAYRLRRRKGMLSEEQKRRIENLYNEYHDLALITEAKKDMKSFYIGKYLAIEDVLRILGYLVLDGEISELN